MRTLTTPNIAAFGTLFLGLGLGCGGPLDTDMTSTGIINGSGPNQPWHEAVVSLHQVYSGGSVDARIFCSGTLIAPDVVLTAGHCLDVASGGKRKFTTMSPSKLAVYVGDAPAQDPSPTVYAVTETLINRNFDRIRLRNDIALVRLAAAAEVTPVGPLPSSLGFASADVDQLVLNSAGFGIDEHGTSGVKLQVDGILGGLGCTVPGCSNGGDSATQISYTQTDSGPCSGDSGGPQFLQRGGTAYVGGVTSFGDGPCTIYGVSTRVDAFGIWIADFVGTAPPPPPPPPDCSSDGACNPDCDPGADPDCGGSASCGDGTCGSGESCDGRSGTSACPSDCPSKKGKPSQRYCYVEGVCEGSGCQ